MAGSLNKASLIGHAGQDPEVRHTQAGNKVASFSLATSDTWRDRQTGERKERTEWHRVVIFNENLAEIVESYVKKGDKLYIEGAIQTRKWTDKDGVDRYTTEIVLQKFNGAVVLLSGKRDDAQVETPQRPPQTTSGLDDEIPF